MDERTTIVPDLPAKVKPNRLRRGGLFIKDEELIERLGVPEKVAREALHALEASPGFPQKQKFWGDRRYWPVVIDYLDFHYGFKLARSQPERKRHA